MPKNCLDVLQWPSDGGECEDSDEDFSDQATANPLYYLTEDRYPESHEFFQGMASMSQEPGRGDWTTFLRLCDTTLKRNRPGSRERQLGVLRNLDTNQFVRDAALAEYCPSADLGEVVVIHACWYGPPSGRPGKPSHRRQLTRHDIDNWTGKRFEIVHPDDFHPGADWTDVSSAAIEALQRELQNFDFEGKRAWVD